MYRNEGTIPKLILQKVLIINFKKHIYAMELGTSTTLKTPFLSYETEVIKERITIKISNLD